MGDDIGLGCICFDALLSMSKRAENDLKRQSVTEPEPMSSPIIYPAQFRQNSSVGNVSLNFEINIYFFLNFKTGMKTNGRKLLTDSLSEEDEKSNHHFNKKQQLKRLKRQPCKVHPKLSSSSSGSNESEVTSPPYRHVLNYKRSNSLTSSTELYAEVYRTSSGESSHSPM